MILFTIDSFCHATLTKDEIIHKGDNNFSNFSFKFPQKFKDFERSECSVEMRCYISENDCLAYNLNASSDEDEIPVTNDLTTESTHINVIFVIRHGETVVGTTNIIGVDINNQYRFEEPPLVPRADIDRTLRELRERISALTEQNETLTRLHTEDTETISGLNTQVETLTSANTNLLNQNETYRQTIQTFINNPPEPKLETLDPINPSQEQVTYRPSGDNIGFNPFTVNPPTAEGLGFDYGNLKKDVEFLGGVGTYDPFPYNSVGGIYITEVDEDGYPVTILVKDYEHSASTFPIFFGKTANAVRALEEVIFENCGGITAIQEGYFNNLTYLKKIVLPENLSGHFGSMFKECRNIDKIEVPSGVTTLNGTFYNCYSVKEIRLNRGLTTIMDNTFYNTQSLKTLNLPNTLDSISYNSLFFNAYIKNLILDQDFNCSFNVTRIPSYNDFTHDDILSWFNALADRTGLTAYTLTIGPTNIDKMAAEEIAIATNKNWNIA